MVPEKDALMRLWWSGRLPADSFARGLLNQGVSWRQDGQDRDRFPSQWWKLIDLEKPMFALDDYRRWFRQGRLTETQLHDAMSRAGFCPEDYAAADFGKNGRNATLFQTDWLNLPVELAIELWRRGVIIRAHAEQCLQVHGYHADDIARLLDQYDMALGVPTLFDLYNRKLIDQPKFEALMKREGIRDDDERAAVAKLRELIPGPSDLVRFALREAWDPAVVARFGYDEEFPKELEYWMQRQGAAGDARTEAQIAAGDPPVNWAQLEWRVHWQNLSPSMAFAFYHRFRPERMAHYGNAFPGLRPFTIDDLYAVLKINDYPVPFRSQIAAANSTLLTRVDIRRLFDLDIIDRVEVKAQYLDRGYVDADAEALTKYTEQQRRIARAGKFTRRTKAQVIDAYNVGVQGPLETAIALYELQFVDPDKLAEFRRRPILQRQDIAFADQGVRFELANTDAERALSNGKLVVKTIHKLYVTAVIDDGETRTRLTNAGIHNLRIDEYLRVWTVERMGPRKILTTKQIQSALAHGIIPLNVATFRLRLLGYTVYDTNVILSEARRSIALEQAKAQQAAAKTLQQQQRAQQAQLKAIQAEKKAVQNELARYATPPQLVKWYARDYIDGRTLETRLRAILDDGTKIAAYIDDARDARQQRLAKLGATP